MIKKITRSPDQDFDIHMFLKYLRIYKSSTNIYLSCICRSGVTPWQLHVFCMTKNTKEIKQQTFNDRECRQYIIECSEGKTFVLTCWWYIPHYALENSLENYQSHMLSHLSSKKTMFHQIINYGMPVSHDLRKGILNCCSYIYIYVIPHTHPQILHYLVISEPGTCRWDSSTCVEKSIIYQKQFKFVSHWFIDIVFNIYDLYCTSACVNHPQILHCLVIKWIRHLQIGFIDSCGKVNHVPRTVQICFSLVH